MNPNEHRRYCKNCGYSLRDLECEECPECGRSFDRSDARTTLRYPNWNPWKTLASLFRAGAVFAILCGIGMIVLSFLGFDPLITKLSAFALTSLMLPLVLMTVIPMRGELATRTRILGLTGVAMIYSVALVDWPLRVNFAFHRSAMEAHASRVLASEKTIISTPTSVGLFTFKKIRIHRGNIGFKLSGGAGGGTFLVLKDPSHEFVWINTNWEWPIGGDWYHVYQD